MKPGLYKDVPDADYRKIEATNQSYLKDLAKSPRHAESRKRMPRTSSAMALGTVADSLLFTPKAFEETHIIYTGSYLKDGTTWTTARSGAGWKSFKENAEREGKIVLSQSEWDQAHDLVGAIQRHPAASELFVGGHAHVVLIGELEGVLSKAQLDYVNTDNDVITDLKSTKDGSPEAFARDAYRYGYHVQAAFYSDLYFAEFGRRASYKIAAVETDKFKAAKDIEVVVYEVPQSLIEWGRICYQASLGYYKKCKETGVFPGISDEVLTLGIPERGQEEIDAAA